MLILRSPQEYYSDYLGAYIKTVALVSSRTESSNSLEPYSPSPKPLNLYPFAFSILWSPYENRLVGKRVPLQEMGLLRNLR